MGRKRTGSVRPYGDKWRAYVGREYLGLYDGEQAAWDRVNVVLRIDADKPHDSLRTFGADWFEDREDAGFVRSVSKERSVWNQHIATAFFYDWPMRRVRPIDVQRWLGELLKKKRQSVITTREGVVRREGKRKLSRQTVAHARRILLACFKQARIEGKVLHNPVEGVPVPRVDRVVEDEDAWAWLTQDEIDRLLDTVTSERLRAFYAVAIYVGLRDGELLGLRWKDVVLDGDSPHVKVRLSYDGAVKTKGSRRDVPLLPVPRDALREWRRQTRGAKVVSAAGLVFPADHGGCHAKGYDAGWPDHRQRVGGKMRVREGWRSKTKIRKHIRFHDLRHTCASHLRMGTWGRALELHEIMAWMGHSDIKTTLRYAHLSPDNLHARAREMGQNKPNFVRKRPGDA